MYLNTTCLDCWDLDPPPNLILTIPPPPIPTFFASSSISLGNQSNLPCPLLCDWNTGLGMEIKDELSNKGNIEGYLMLVSIVLSFAIVLVTLGMLFTLPRILKFRQNSKTKSCLQNSVYGDRIYEAILYPSLKDNNELWTTLSSKGKPQAVVLKLVPPPLPPRTAQISSYENCNFSDTDDSLKYSKLHVSSPVRVENPNMLPLNFYPSFKCNTYFSLV